MSDPSATPHKLVTAILPKGRSVSVARALKDELGVIACNINNARGVGRITPLRHRHLGDQSEKEILNVVVEAERADAIFEFIHARAEIDHPHGGLLFMGALSLATSFTLPAVPDEPWD